MGTETKSEIMKSDRAIFLLSNKTKNPLMGTETKAIKEVVPTVVVDVVSNKSKNPLMGTETNWGAFKTRTRPPAVRLNNKSMDGEVT